MVQRRSESYSLGSRCARRVLSTMKAFLVALVCMATSDVEALPPLRLACEACGTGGHFPTFEDLHQRLFARAFDKDDNSTHVIISYSNPYGLRPSFNNYPHSNLLPEFFLDLLDGLSQEGGPRFVVEVGSLHGHSAIQMATVLDSIGLTDVPILCIDPFTGDTNMWQNYQEDVMVAKWVNIMDGRMTVFDQFMANVQFALTRSLTSRHILPFHATSTVGARWLQQVGYTPDLIFLDSAHEAHETFMELAFYYSILLPGGILFGDDYGWDAVRNDVHRFVNEHNSHYGENEPIDLRIVRARAGAANVLWIIQKAKV
eukprot:TRINITY_DN70412_c0_g1_i1.p1 TRINITY_DN70412_c0_g1~~TRINITY_DN70412_c0_g1_i1.p1  ORF type:complete len:315 (-),score=25.04 TRINITY_DN70412_c0_g1_i1:75-1019(-)